MSDTRLLGIDVSHYQGNVDWPRVAQGTSKFAFAKATQNSTFVDPQFERNWKGVGQAGLFRGAYHFASPGGDPETQAAHFASVVGALGARDMPPVLDLEESDGHPAEHVLRWAEAFVHKAEALFRRPLLIYTGGFWRFQLGNPDSAFFRSRPLWLAAYSATLVVPKSWSRWTFWQFSDGTQNGGVLVPGIRGPVDQNRFDGGEAELTALCNERASATLQPATTGESWPGQHFVWPNTPAIASDAVRKWQERQVALGFLSRADGSYGPMSKAACMAFQRERGLKADGIVGPKTWAVTFEDSR